MRGGYGIARIDAKDYGSPYSVHNLLMSKSGKGLSPFPIYISHKHSMAHVYPTSLRSLVRHLFTVSASSMTYHTPLSRATFPRQESAGIETIVFRGRGHKKSICIHACMFVVSICRCSQIMEGISSPLSFRPSTFVHVRTLNVTGGCQVRSN